jgi:hypothetical protein
MDLVQICATKVGQGANIPVIWADVLRSHRLFAGPPLQFYDERRPQLDIPVLTGQRLISDPTSRTFVLR